MFPTGTCLNTWSPAAVAVLRAKFWEPLGGRILLGTWAGKIILRRFPRVQGFYPELDRGHLC